MCSKDIPDVRRMLVRTRKTANGHPPNILSMPQKDVVTSEDTYKHYGSVFVLYNSNAKQMIQKVFVQKNCDSWNRNDQPISITNIILSRYVNTKETKDG